MFQPKICPLCGRYSLLADASAETYTCAHCKAAYTIELIEKLDEYSPHPGPDTWNWNLDELRERGVELPTQCPPSTETANPPLILQIANAFNLQTTKSSLGQCPACNQGKLNLHGGVTSPVGWNCESCNIGGNSFALAAFLAQANSITPL